MSTLRAIAVIVASIIVVVVIQRHLGSAKMQERPKMGGDISIVATEIKPRRFENRIESIGSARANESISITSTVSERVTEILFEGGETVKKGDVLVRLENREETADWEEAKVDLAEQKREFARLKNLLDKKVVAQQAYDVQRSAMEAAEARLAAAEARLHDRTIRAPFSGVVGIRQVSPGALVSPGTEIATLDDLGTIKAEFSVPETFLSELKIGQEVRARCAAWPGTIFTGQVKHIDSRVNQATRAITIQAMVPNPKLKLRNGMLLTVELISRPRNALGVPEGAIISYAEKQFVYTLEKDSTVTKREVALGLRDVGWVEITKGLEDGQKIIIEGLMDLQDGAKVKVINKTTETNQTVPAKHN